MAISGSFYGTTSNSAIKPKITWTAQKSDTENCSQVTATLSYSRRDTYKTYGQWGGTLTIHGNAKSASGKYIEITKNSNTVAISHTVTVPHNEDGTMSIEISASGSISGTTLSKTQISAQVELEKIPRAASVAATDADIGSVSMVTIGKKSDAYTYTVAWQFGSLNGYLGESGIAEESVQVIAHSLAFALPEAFYYEIPDKSSGICTLTCTTYLNGLIIGTPQTTTFTVRANPERCAPLLHASVLDCNSQTLALTKDETRFIRYASDALCSLDAQARLGATITQKKIAGQSVSEDTVTLAQVDTDAVSFAVTDSRGYTTEVEIPLDLIPYFLPVLRLQAARTDATSGEAKLQAEGNFYQAGFGGADNLLRLHCQVGDRNLEMTPVADEEGFQGAIVLTDLDYTQSHLITVTAADAIHSVTAQVRINPGIPVFDWGKQDFRFHVPVFVQDQELLPLVEQTAADAIHRTGDTMVGNLSMSGHRITDLGEPQSAEDAVTKAYADGQISMHLLWENASPTSSFAQQTIQMDLSEYQMVLCQCRLNQTAATIVPSNFIRVGAESGADAYGIVTGYPVRRTIIATAEGVEFGEGCKYTSFGSSNVNANSTVLIPVEIYGLKGVGV